MPRGRARRDDPAPPDSLILRGYPMTQDVLLSNAQDNYDVYGFYGVSVFRADTQDEVNTACATKLRALAKIAVFKASHLASSGLSLWATGSRPHYDVVRGPNATDLDGLIERLLATAWSEHTNPHYREGEGR